MRDIARQLGVANIVEGSVQKVANTVKVTVQLIRATTDEHIWPDSHSRKLDDIFGVEGEIAGAVQNSCRLILPVHKSGPFRRFDPELRRP